MARVAKGAGKVARAFLQVEGPVVARQALRLKDHGGGLAYSLKNVGSHYLLFAYFPRSRVSKQRVAAATVGVDLSTFVHVMIHFHPADSLTQLHRRCLISASQCHSRWRTAGAHLNETLPFRVVVFRLTGCFFGSLFRSATPKYASFWHFPFPPRRRRRCWPRRTASSRRHRQSSSPARCCRGTPSGSYR